MKSPRHMPARPVSRHGFTLVEIMVVVVIIGILLSLVVPATMRAIQRARETEAKMEISSLASAVEQYQQRWNDYPPDGSDLPVLQRHMRKVFPRMAEPDQSLLFALTHPDGSNFSSVAMDRAEALVFFLGGFSEDVAHPLTGAGGPLETDQSNEGSTALSDYQYNATRDGALFEFAPERLTFGLSGNRYVSTDEAELGYADVEHGVTPQNGPDLLPAYRSTRARTPILYFDSRSYGVVSTGAYNGYWAGGEFGGVRPYKTSIGIQPPTSGSYASAGAAFNAVNFQNRDTFQIISPGGDGIYGALVSIDPSDRTSPPIHFITDENEDANIAAGTAVTPNPADIFDLGSIGPSISRFQESSWPGIINNGHLDNVTNFSTSTLESDLP